MKTFARRKWIFVPPIILAAFLAFGFVTMALWNALLPGIFHLPVITFWQAIGLLILARLFFGGGHWGHGRHYWSRGMREKYHNMTPEEREKFRQQWHDYAHHWRGCCGDDKFQEKKDDQSV